MNKYITQYLVKHNGKNYPTGSEIELEDAADLIAAKAVKLIEKTNPDNDKNGMGGQTPPNPKPADGKEYRFMKDAEQVEFLKTLSEEELKSRFNELLEVSKTQAKKVIKNRIKMEE